MRKNILAKRILCALAVGGIACGAFATAYAENITISRQEDVATGNHFNHAYHRITPSGSTSNNTLSFNGNLNFA